MTHWHFCLPGPPHQHCASLSKAGLVINAPSCQRSLCCGCLLHLFVILNPLHPSGKYARNDGTSGSDAACDRCTETLSYEENKHHQP
jgi:hypothetical protein